MSIKEMRCQTCADAGLPQRYNWSKTKQAGIAVFGICQHSTDFRTHHALKDGRSRWFHRVMCAKGTLGYMTIVAVFCRKME